MSELKSLTRDGITLALEKAEQYRLLNEPWEAESICLDVLEIDPGNQRALVTLILALTDQFGIESAGLVSQARSLLDRLDGEYERTYYAGIICERQAKAILRRGTPGTGPVVYDFLRQAMDWFERAEQRRPPGHDDALLRWNTCVRLIERHPTVQPEPDEITPSMLE